jgi:hypothetical protein
MLVDEQRSKHRYPITLDLQYRLLKQRGQGSRVGYGTTLNVSSGGVLFETDQQLPAKGAIELAIEWPMLQGVYGLKLLMRGHIVRSNTQTKRTAIRIEYHEFCTASVSPRHGIADT